MHFYIFHHSRSWTLKMVWLALKTMPVCISKSSFRYSQVPFVLALLLKPSMSHQES